MALNFTGFKQKLFSLMKVNETEDKAYQLSYAGGNSGYSYGWVQFDLAAGPNIGRERFKDILKNATDDEGNNIIPTEDVETLYKAALTRGGNELTPEQIILIDAALDSAYGRQTIDEATSKHLDWLISQADSWVTKAPADDKAFLQSDLGKLWLCDCYNQGFMPVTAKPEQFASFLQGQAYRGYTKQGALSFDDILEVYFRQRQAANFVPWDPFRRLANIVEAAGGYTPASLEEAKGILRAYTYYYVRNETILMQNQTYIDSVNVFRNKVNKPAEQMILDNWKPEWGPRPGIGDYDDMLMGDDKDNKRNSGDYQLNGRDGNDIIFGEGGNDQIEGGKGDDILLGGTGHDTYIYSIGDGNDRIIDEDKDGKIVIFDSNGTEINRRVLGNFYKSGENEWKLPDGSTITITQNSPTTVVLPDGSTIDLGENFQDGDFGIHLLDVPDAPQPNIVGDLTPHDFDPITDGIQIKTDEWGNVITDPGNPAPNRNDYLYDTSGSDHIEGKGGDDYINAKRGGNDWLLGGAGNDILNGGAGDDQVFGESSGEMETFVENGETAVGINEKGDLVSGGSGNDLVYGANRNDTLLGGDGHDLLVGGGGDDVIFGDKNLSIAMSGWSTTVEPYELIEGGKKSGFYGYVIYGINQGWVEDTFKGDDTIYAGTGNDYIAAGGGDDEVYAGLGDDVVFGEGGDDFIEGGDGNDHLAGDLYPTLLPIAEHGNDYIDGGAGDDKIRGGGGNDILFGGDGNDLIHGDYTEFFESAGDDYIDGGAGDDIIRGNGGNDTIYGSDGNDWLQGDDGDDYLDGGAGNDYLYGGYGSDIFRFDIGSGQDTISDYNFVNERNTVEFGEGINSTDLELYKEGDDLHIKFKGITDSLILSSWFIWDHTWKVIDKFRFADGTVLSADDINAIGYKVYGTAGDDLLIGSFHKDEILGYDGNDILEGSAGDDILDGGTGNDFLMGDEGNDTYIFGIGSGQDTICDYSYFASSYVDKVEFGEGIAVTDLRLVNQRDDLIININGYNDSLLIKNWFADNDYKIEQFKFADGTVLNALDIEAMGYEIHNKLYGTSGNDLLEGSSLSEEIYGYEGDDQLIGYSGYDVLDGGTGNDALDGGTGNDTYIFGIGSGQDSIYDLDETPGNIDTVKFAEGIIKDDLEFVKEDYDLRINIKGSTDSLLIAYWFSSNHYKIEQFRFADGSILTPSDIDAIGYKIYGTSDNDYLRGRDENARYEIYGHEGNDELYGNKGEDILDGGEGNDYMEGSTGNDTYIFNKGGGNDTIYDSDWNDGNIDVVEFGEGITAGDLELVRDGYNLCMNIKGSTDSLTIKSWFLGNAYKIEQFKFSDGTLLTPSDIEAMNIRETDLNKIYGTSADDYLNATNMNDEVYGYEGNDYLYGINGDDIIYGGEGDDFLSGWNGNDTFYGDAGDDTLTGGPGNDMLDGGEGDDLLRGGEGDDIYIYGKGSGNDSINSYEWDWWRKNINGTDTVQFKSGLTVDSLEYIKDQSDLILKIKETGETLTFSCWFDGEAYQVEQFRFADGTVLTAEDLDTIGYRIYGTSDSDFLDGSYGNDEIFGYEGDDIIDSWEGNDIIEAGTGNDIISGDTGSDTYIFNLGDGEDIISERDWEGMDTNVVKFGEGITEDNLIISKQDNNLLIKIKDSTDSITITDWFSPWYGYDTKVQRFEFSDGTVWDTAMIQSILCQPTDGDDNLIGTSEDDVIDGGSGNDQIYGYEGNDTLYGSSGDDYLDGSWGDDTLIGGEGNDTLVDNYGINVLDGGPGDDSLIGSPDADNTYIIKRGGGFDNVTVEMVWLPVCDTVVFGEGITPDDLSIQVNGSGNIIQLAIGIGNDEGMLIKGKGYGGMNVSNLVAQHFVFADGQELTLEQIIARADNGVIGYQSGTEGDDFLRGSVANDNIYGNAGDDQIDARDNEDWLDGGLGNDTLLGGSGDDIVYGGAGDDILNGGTGADNMIGGTGNDTYIVDNIGDVVTELTNEGVDTVQSSISYSLGVNVENLILTGSDAINGTGNELDNVIAGNSADNVLISGDGSDMLSGGTGNDELYGGEGTDTYIFNIGDGVDTIQDITTDTEGNLIVFGEGITRDDLKLTQTGNVLTIQVGTNGDAIRLVNFDPDNINGSLVVQTVEFVDGTQVLLKDLLDPGTEGDDIINTGAGNDVINAKGGNDIVNTNGGNDTITGGRGNDILNGGTGDDTYIFNAGDGIDTINDLASVTEGNKIIFGAGITPDDLRLSYKDNTLIISVGSNGDIVQLTNFNPDDAYGTHAIDTFQFVDGTQLTYNQLIDKGFDLNGTIGDDTINGTNVTDRIITFEGNDIINAGEGNNIIDAGEGDDNIITGTGNDIITGSIGNDTLNGGKGNDVYTYNIGDGLDNLTDTEGIDTLSMGQGIDFDHTIIRMDAATAHLRILDLEGNETAQGIDIALNPDGSIPVETISFTDGSSFNMKDLVIESQTTYGTRKSDFIHTGRNDDTIYARQGGDTVYAGLSNDTVYGNNGKDRLYGEQGNDKLYGNNGDDILDGGNGNDILYGGNGDDTLTGGNGNDTLYGDNGNDVINGGKGDDIINTGRGDDIIHFDSGDGRDIIKCDGDCSGKDTIKFGSSIAKENIVLFKEGDDLLAFSDIDDYIRVQNQFKTSNYGIERIEATDGYYVSRRDIENIVNAMIDFNNDSGMDIIQRYDNLQNNQQYMAMLAQSWHQPQNTYTA